MPRKTPFDFLEFRFARITDFLLGYRIPPLEMSFDSTTLEPLGLSALRSAQGYYELGMLVECEASLQELTLDERQRPESAELQILVGLDRKDYRQALASCDQAIRDFPDAPFGHVNKAYALHEMGRTAEALEVLENAHLVVSVEAVAIYNRGCYLACLERKSEAVFWVKKAIRLEPDLEAQALNDPDLSAIHDLLEDR